MELNSKVKIYSLNPNLSLATEVAQKLNKHLEPYPISYYSDGEVKVEINDSVRGNVIYILQTFSGSANDRFMELLIFIDALKRASAKEINVIIPYYGYGRYDQKKRARAPITSKLVANLLQTAGAERIITFDLYSDQSQGFFDIPLDHLTAVDLLSNYFSDFNLNDFVVLATENVSLTRARKFADNLNLSIVFTDQEYSEDNDKKNIRFIGDIKGKHVIIMSDIIDTASTVTDLSESLKFKGAENIYVCATHPIFSSGAGNKLSSSLIKKVIITNSIPIDNNKLPEKFKVVSLAPILSTALKYIHNNKSISSLFT